MKETIKFELVQDVFMNLVMTIATVILTTGFVGFTPFFSDFSKAYIINVVSGIILNYVGFFPGILNKLNKYNKAKFFPACVGLVNATLITFCMTAINVGINDSFISAWLSTYPILVIVAICSAFIFTPITSRIIK